jgi:hypothetical protein
MRFSNLIGHNLRGRLHLFPLSPQLLHPVQQLFGNCLHVVREFNRSSGTRKLQIKNTINTKNTTIGKINNKMTNHKARTRGGSGRRLVVKERHFGKRLKESN